jgi:hypothetical protein
MARIATHGVMTALRATVIAVTDSTAQQGDRDRGGDDRGLRPLQLRCKAFQVQPTGSLAGSPVLHCACCRFSTLTVAGLTEA